MLRRANVALGSGDHAAALAALDEHEASFPRGVMIAEDTGSAIVGPARGDMFMGSGAEAGRIAGEMKAAARLTLILPKSAP